MKKQILLFAAAFCISISSLMAQEARQKATPEERTKATMEKLAAFDLDKSVRIQTEAIFNDFYAAQQASMRDARAAGSDRNAIMQQRKINAANRDAKLKEILTAEQYGKWISQIEPTLRPQPMTDPAGAKVAPASPEVKP